MKELDFCNKQYLGLPVCTADLGNGIIETVHDGCVDVTFPGDIGASIKRKY